ncbi:GtrA family protein [Pendulispora albinea]|uniref:GtrA family protein n=1 Tax=Pendulispora albinea TaxID=2741071 RepID=A0ABZ2LPX7_9BACT
MNRTMEARTRPGPSTLHLLGRHQMASIVATAIDFGTMTVLVELGVLSPAIATLVGAAFGAVVNFLLGRRIFRATGGSAAPQAVRYALVSSASAGFNSLGVFVLHHQAGLQYLLARVAVSILVSILWNFPLHRHFVFRDRGAST